MTYVRNATSHKQKKTARNTLFTKIKVILEEKWSTLLEHLSETLCSEQFLLNLGIYYIIVGRP